MIGHAAWFAEVASIIYATIVRASVCLLFFWALLWFARHRAASHNSVLTAAALGVLLLLPIPRAFPFGWAAAVLPPPLAWPLVAVGTVEYGAAVVAQAGTHGEATTFADPDFVRVVALGCAVSTVGWALGTLTVLIRMVGSWLSVRRIFARSVPAADASWLELVDEARHRFNIRQPVSLRLDPEQTVPLTWGTLHPLLILPEVARRWPRDYQRAVVFHEMAHVRARDALGRILSGTACALFWFHPGVWWLARRHEAEREASCDDAVLRQGIRPSVYAECLLELKESIAAPRYFGTALLAPHVTSASVPSRIHWLLDPANPRATAGRWSFALAAAAVAAAVMVVGSARLAPTRDEVRTHLRDWRWERRGYAVRVIARTMLLSDVDSASLTALTNVANGDPHRCVRDRARYALVLLGRERGASSRIPNLPP